MVPPEQTIPIAGLRAQSTPSAVVARPIASSTNSALIVGIVGCLRVCHIPMRQSLRTLALLLRTTLFPPPWTACGGPARGFGIDAEVIRTTVDVGPICLPSKPFTGVVWTLNACNGSRNRTSSELHH